MKQIKLFIIAILLTLTGFAQTLQPVLYTTGFNSPVDIASCGDDRLFIVERRGKIQAVDANGVKQSVPFLDIDSIVSDGNDERGLLGLTFDPNYNSNGYFYVYYITNAGNSQISRYTRTGGFTSNVANPNSKVNILTVTQPPSFNNHKGGDIEFGPDGYLYIGFGDGGSSGDPNNYSQNTQSLLGKMLRIDVSTLPYTIPSSNPFVSSAPLDEIWAIGLRNPWRWSFDKITGELWIADVGQSSWEEINKAQPNQGGINYGWRCYEGNAAYNLTGCLTPTNYQFPVFAYPHSGANPSGCSITGGFVYRGTKYKSLFGKYIFADYCAGALWGLTSTYSFIDYGNLGFGIAAFGQSPYGELFVVNVNTGNLYKLTTNECKPVAYINSPDSFNICVPSQIELNALKGDNITYSWMRNGQVIAGQTTDQFYPTTNGSYQVIVTNSQGCKDTSAAKVLYTKKPQAVLTGNDNFCTGGSAVLTVTHGAGNTYEFKKSNQTIATTTQPIYTAVTGGKYKVTVTDPTGCYKTSNTITVTGPPTATINVNGPLQICIGDSVEMSVSTSGLNYQWKRNGVNINNAVNQVFYAKTNGSYRVVVTNQYNCSKTSGIKQVSTVQCRQSIQPAAYYQIYDMQGRLVHQYQGSQEELMEWKRTHTGMFILKAIDAEFNVVQIVKI